jgi:hypothetical protein
MALVIEEVNRHDEEKRETDFTFHHLPEVSFDCVATKKNLEKLTQWGMVPGMELMKFRYEEPLQRADLPAFVTSFFKSPICAAALNQCGGAVINRDRLRVRYTECATKEVSLAFLRQLEDAGCVSANGHIRGRPEEEYEGVPIYDMVREALYHEESEIYDTFSSEDRKEFLLHIFKRLVVGGALNQYEEYIEPYTSMTKDFYRDLCTVRKNDAGDVEVLSWVVQVTDLGPGGVLFPKKAQDRELQNYCYLVIDPVVRHVSFWHYGYRSVWGM